ncbi:MAG: class I SAM-dependent RNA methyltransferase [Bacteriovorax sp.]|jgi:23S rRNA (uracil1939-C5)-methyltransferase|nr:class I SAM-dependent RNA methyltransferase [Bacteriovorax sp.]
MKIDFRIEHIDPLGQGVSKNEKLVTFIKKTLPGETGDADVYSEKKGVRFAKLSTLKESSPERIEAECVHFSKCNGCDYQHTTYEKELEYKKQALARHLLKFPEVPITVHGAKRRLGYRNRIQLHYDKKKKLLGLMDEQNNIVPVPQCKIIDPSIAFELRALYENDAWFKMLMKEPVKGHLELYAKDQDKPGHNVKVSLNRPYAFGGFTQVNFEMNEKLRDWIQKTANTVIPPKAIVYDLFGGNGNLSKKFKNTTLVVDKYRTVPQAEAHQKFFSIDLYDKNGLKALIALKNEGHPRPNWLVIDPPRSGLKNLEEFLAEFKPDGFIFIACEATSFTRDTFSTLKNYDLQSIDLFDLFPSTKAFETIGIFTRRKINE